jgi:hypothetical protein
MQKGCPRAIAITLGLAISVWGCAKIQVTTRSDPATDFSRFRTYSQDSPPRERADTPRYSAALGAQIQAEIARQLEVKGLRPAPEGADLRVAFRVSGVARTRMINAGDPDADYYIPQEYREGALVIEVFDARGNPVWSGVGHRKVFQDTNVEKVALEAVDAILAEFPLADRGS